MLPVPQQSVLRRVPRRRGKITKGYGNSSVMSRWITAGVSPRVLWIALASIVALAVAVLALVFIFRGGAMDDGSVEFVGFSENSTATVGFAGQFPSLESPALVEPRGIDADGERLFVALSGTGAVGVFGYNGARIATISIPPAEGAPVAYPIDVDVISAERVAVIDTSGGRLVFVNPEEPESQPRTLEATGEFSLSQPTSAEFFDGELFVADASDQSIKVFDANGDPLRIIGKNLVPPLAFIGGMHVSDGLLWVSDSIAGRVLALSPADGTVVNSLQKRFDLPRGMISAMANRLLVAEAFAGTVGMFDAGDLSALESIGDPATEGLDRGGLMTKPEAVWWDAQSSRAYITDSAQGRVKVFNLREAPE